MDWIDLIGRAEFIRQLFPQAPLLHGVRVLEVGFHQDGPRVLIRFDLNEYPKKPPAKWNQAGANTVQLRLMGIGIRELEMRGWTSNNIAEMKVEAVEPHGLCLVAQAQGFYFRASFEHIELDGVSAYTNDDFR